MSLWILKVEVMFIHTVSEALPCIMYGTCHFKEDTEKSREGERTIQMNDSPLHCPNYYEMYWCVFKNVSNLIC